MKWQVMVGGLEVGDRRTINLLINGIRKRVIVEVIEKDERWVKFEIKGREETFKLHPEEKLTLSRGII